MFTSLALHFFAGIIVDWQLFDFETISFVVNLVCETAQMLCILFLVHIACSLLVLMVIGKWNFGMTLIG